MGGGGEGRWDGGEEGVGWEGRETKGMTLTGRVAV